jgi:AraC-like DNA-binding protein
MKAKPKQRERGERPPGNPEIAMAPTAEDLAELESAAGELDGDSRFHAEYLKSLFVEQVLEAMAARGESQNQLARRWGKSRQYVSKLFREDKRVNFTIETMTEIVALLGRRLDLRVRLQSEEDGLVVGRNPLGLLVSENKPAKGGS